MQSLSALSEGLEQAAWTLGRGALTLRAVLLGLCWVSYVGASGSTLHSSTPAVGPGRLSCRMASRVALLSGFHLGSAKAASQRERGGKCSCDILFMFLQGHHGQASHFNLKSQLLMAAFSLLPLWCGVLVTFRHRDDKDILPGPYSPWDIASSLPCLTFPLPIALSLHAILPESFYVECGISFP